MSHDPLQVYRFFQLDAPDLGEEHDHFVNTLHPMRAPEFAPAGEPVPASCAPEVAALDCVTVFSVVWVELAWSLRVVRHLIERGWAERDEFCEVRAGETSFFIPRPRRVLEDASAPDPRAKYYLKGAVPALAARDGLMFFGLRTEREFDVGSVKAVLSRDVVASLLDGGVREYSYYGLRDEDHADPRR